TDLGLREDSRGDVLMIHLGRIALEGALDEAHRFVDGYRRQLHAVRDISDGPYVVYVRPRIVVDEDLPLHPGLDACRLQSQVLGIGDAPDGQHDPVEGFDTPRYQMRGEAAIGLLLHHLDDILADDADALGLHRFMQSSAQIAGEP